MTTLQKKVIQLARKSGACYRIAEIEACKSDRELVTLMFRHWDFVREKQFPPMSLLRQNRTLLSKHHILLDEVDAYTTGSVKMALFDSEVTVKTGGFDSQVFYATGASSLKITATGHALVVIDASGLTEVRISATDKASVIITLHDSASLQAAECKNIKVIDRRHVKV
jgi:hypothetical protein